MMSYKILVHFFHPYYDLLHRLNIIKSVFYGSSLQYKINANTYSSVKSTSVNRSLLVRMVESDFVCAYSQRKGCVNVGQVSRV